MFGKRHTILQKVPASADIFLAVQSCTHNSVITYKKKQINLMHRGDYDDQRVWCTDTENVYTQMILQSLFLLYFSILWLTHIFFPSLPSRAGLSSERQRTRPSFPERVSAGHGVKPHRGVLLRTGPSVLAELHIQVQSYCGRGPETPVTSWVPQCIAPWRGFTQVRVLPSC